MFVSQLGVELGNGSNILGIKISALSLLMALCTNSEQEAALDSEMLSDTITTQGLEGSCKMGVGRVNLSELEKY